MPTTRRAFIHGKPFLAAAAAWATGAGAAETAGAAEAGAACCPDFAPQDVQNGDDVFNADPQLPQNAMYYLLKSVRESYLQSPVRLPCIWLFVTALPRVTVLKVSKESP